MKVYLRPERITRVAKSASGFHQVVLMRTDLTVIVALSLRRTLLLLRISDLWLRRENKQLQLLEAIKASRLLLQVAINQATLRPHHQLFRPRSLVTNLPPLTSRTVSLDQLDSIASPNSSKALPPIRSRSALVQVPARVLEVQGGMKPPNLKIMVSSIQMLISPPNLLPETISSPQLRPSVVMQVVYANLKTETVSLPVISKSSTQKMALMRSPSATRSLTLAQVCLEVLLWLLKKEAGPLVPLRTRDSQILKITRATWTISLTTALRTSTMMMTSCEEEDRNA